MPAQRVRAIRAQSKLERDAEGRELPDGTIQPPRAPENVVSRAFTIVLALGICAISYGLWRDPLRWYLLRLDDFEYLAGGRTAPALTRDLFTPHYGHIVPLFRLATHALGRIAGSLEALPGVLGWACFATLALAILLMGHVVARETGRPDRGLIAMAAVGFSSVLGSAVHWYASSQALACGVMTLATLAALQLWRAGEARWAFLLGLLAALAAPLLWTAGYVAGPAGAAYLLAHGRRRCREAAVFLIVVSVAWCVAVRDVSRRLSSGPSPSATRIPWEEVRPARGMVHSAQAFCELLAKNLGLDTATTGPQAMVLTVILAGAWFWSRRRSDPNGDRWWPRINPLEASGAVMIAGSLGMIYSIRGTLADFEELRTEGWYDAVALLGTVLFVFGWWSGPIESPPPQLEYPGRPRLLVSVLLIGMIFVLQAPRVDRVIYRYDGMGAWPAPDAPSHPPILTLADLKRRARDQRQTLAALDRLEQTAREKGLTRAEVETALKDPAFTGLILAAGSVRIVLDLLEIRQNPANDN